jgi:hypothetical protein
MIPAAAATRVPVDGGEEVGSGAVSKALALAVEVLLYSRG